MKRKRLNQQGKRAAHELLSKPGRKYKYKDCTPVEARPCACWLAESDMGELRLLITDPKATMDFVVELLAKYRWRPKFKVTMIDAADLQIKPSRLNQWYSPDARSFNQNLEMEL